MSHYKELLKARSVANGMTVLVFTNFVTVVLVATVLEAAVAGPPPASPCKSFSFMYCHAQSPNEQVHEQLLSLWLYLHRNLSTCSRY